MLLTSHNVFLGLPRHFSRASQDKVKWAAAPQISLGELWRTGPTRGGARPFSPQYYIFHRSIDGALLPSPRRLSPDLNHARHRGDLHLLHQLSPPHPVWVTASLAASSHLRVLIEGRHLFCPWTYAPPPAPPLPASSPSPLSTAPPSCLSHIF